MQYNRNPKAEIIRCVQKDLTYTNEIAADFSDILQLVRPRNWIRYNHLSNFFSEIVYHGFASLQNLQTLGEEYTGIFQIDNKLVSIPSKLLRLTAIILEFGGELFYVKLLNVLEKNVTRNEDILPEAKIKIKNVIEIMKKSIPFIKAIHKGFFYYSTDNSKYQISKRLTGIKYIHVRNWMKADHSLYGYRLLGILTFLQISVVVVLKMYENCMKKNNILNFNNNKNENFITDDFQSKSNYESPKCTLCLEPRKNTSLTPCGHIFCWECILDWLDEKDECPLCRDKIGKSNIIPLQNFL